MELKNKIFKLSLLLNVVLILIMLNNELLHMIKQFNNKRIAHVMSGVFPYNARFYNFPKKTNIVMLGDSITQNIVWDELLGRSDIANRGVGGDSTEDFLNRLDQIYVLKPRLCFVMGGINDLTKQATVDEVFGNIVKIVERLKQHNIIPIVQSTLFTSLSNERNSEVFRLDKFLKEYCNKNSVEYLDLNVTFSKDNKLLVQYTKDGIHLNDNGYKLWESYLLPVIRKDGL